ncbi:uncharacterized protein LOC123306824 [Coccinella septempunctata]|uniref:uncharacterized protein LOC123306824 n=1 Tax=Coccinella septempunctata TaxID=41139 RepID=UPI001D08461E|nr:uncharacterized protein LOC123306824 [Coccinella septempunctata]
MSTNENITSNRIARPSEKLTLFSICCPCLRPKKLTCRASDIALVMYDKDEPHEYVLEKLVIKRVPLRFFGVEEDFVEYERSLKEDSKTTCEKEIAVTDFDEIKSVEVEAVRDEKPVEVHEEIKKQPSQEMEMEAVQAVTSGNSLKVNCNTPVEEFLQSKLSFACEPLTDPKSGEELILRTITANEEQDLVTEVDQRIAKMSPDLEHTINVLKGVKPRPVSTQGTPMPIKNQRRLVPRNVEHEGIITKGAYNYMPCPKDHPLLGIHYTLNKTTFAPPVEETSKSIITDLHIANTTDQDSKVATSIMIDEATTNYEDATVLAGDDVSTIRPSMFNMPSIRNLSDEEDYIRSDYSSDSTNFQGTFGSKRFGSFFNKPHEQKTDFGTTDFSVYHAEVAHRFGRRVPPSRSSKKRNLKWKIVINNHPKDIMAPTTSTSEFQLSNSRKSPCKGYFSKSGLSF